MRIASPASKSPSKPVQALTGTLFGVKLRQSLSAVSVARHCFFWATPDQKLHPYVTQILSSFLRIVKCIFAKSPAVKMSTLNSTFFHVFIVLPFCTIRNLFYCIFSLLGSAIVRLPLLPASHAPYFRSYASCFTSSSNSSPAE